MAKVRGKQQQPVLLWSKHTPRDSCIPIGDGHHVAEVIVRRLKLQLTTGVVGLRSHVEHSTELRIAMGVGLDRPALPGADHWPCFLDMNLQGVMRPEQFPQECIHVDSQLLVQPLKCFQAMQLIQSCFAQQIAGEVVAIAELRMRKDLAIE